MNVQQSLGMQVQKIYDVHELLVIMHIILVQQVLESEIGDEQYWISKVAKCQNDEPKKLKNW
jgi:hypothetical protein